MKDGEVRAQRTQKSGFVRDSEGQPGGCRSAPGPGDKLCEPAGDARGDRALAPGGRQPPEIGPPAASAGNLVVAKRRSGGGACGIRRGTLRGSQPGIGPIIAGRTGYPGEKAGFGPRDTGSAAEFQ